MLDTQYRMHPSISSFPAAEFYRGTVRDGTVDESGRVSKELEPPRSVYLRALDLSTPTQMVEGSPESSLGLEDLNLGDEVPQVRDVEVLGECVEGEAAKNAPSVIFLDHAGKETTRDRSRVNHKEANIIASVVVDLLLSNPVSPASVIVFRFFLSFSRSVHPPCATVAPWRPPWDSPVLGPHGSESRSGPHPPSRRPFVLALSPCPHAAT